MLDRWRLAYDLAPWGEERFDRAMGELILWLQTVNGVKKPAAVEEVMPYLRKPKPPAEPMSDENVLACFAAVAKMMGGELAPVKK